HDEAVELEATITQQQPGPELAREASERLISVLLQRDVLLLSAQYIFWSLGVYGLVLWLPAIIHKASGQGIGNTGLLNAVPYFVAILAEIIMGHVADRTGRTDSLVWPFLIISGFAMAGSFLLAPFGFVPAFICLIVACGAMYAPYPPFFSIIPDRVPRQHAGIVFALVNSCGALGGFLGTYFVGWLRGI